MLAAFLGYIHPLLTLSGSGPARCEQLTRHAKLPMRSLRGPSSGSPAAAGAPRPPAPTRVGTSGGFPIRVAPPAAWYNPGYWASTWRITHVGSGLVEPAMQVPHVHVDQQHRRCAEQQVAAATTLLHATGFDETWGLQPVSAPPGGGALRVTGSRTIGRGSGCWVSALLLPGAGRPCCRRCPCQPHVHQVAAPLQIVRNAHLGRQLFTYLAPMCLQPCQHVLQVLMHEPSASSKGHTIRMSSPVPARQPDHLV